MPLSADIGTPESILPCWQLHSIQISTIVANEVSLWVANIRMRPLPASCVFYWLFVDVFVAVWVNHDEKQHITNLVPAWVWYWGKIIAVAVLLLMLAVRCSFKPKMHQFHSFHQFLYTLPHSQLEKSEGIIPRCSFLSESEGSWRWQNKDQLSGKYIYIYSSISGIQDQVSILLGWLYFKDSSFFHFTKMCRGYLYIYICICVIYSDGYFGRYMYNIYGFRGALQHQFFDPGFFSFGCGTFIV